MALGLDAVLARNLNKIVNDNADEMIIKQSKILTQEGSVCYYTVMEEFLVHPDNNVYDVIDEGKC